MSEHLLEVKNLKTGFNIPGGVVSAVRGVDFHVDHGEFLGIVGESGCGKSVTMLSIMRLLADNAFVTADAISFDGADMMAMSEKETRKIHGNQIGMIFQDPLTCLNPLFTIGNQLCEPLKVHKNMKKTEAKARAIELLDLVGISSPESRLKQYPHEFSGGMRQRAMIAMAMSCNPKLLIADEPTTALDVTIQTQILELMKSLRDRFSMATVLITHDLGVIASTCSRVIVMYGGLIMEHGTVEDIFYRTGHPYTKGLLNSVPGMGERKKDKLIPIPGSPPDLMRPPAGCPFAARCDYTMRVCTLAQPELTELLPGHHTACWLKHPKARAMTEVL